MPRPKHQVPPAQGPLLSHRPIPSKLGPEVRLFPGGPACSHPTPGNPPSSYRQSCRTQWPARTPRDAPPRPAGPTRGNSDGGSSHDHGYGHAHHHRWRPPTPELTAHSGVGGFSRRPLAGGPGSLHQTNYQPSRESLTLRLAAVDSFSNKRSALPPSRHGCRCSHGESAKHVRMLPVLRRRPRAALQPGSGAAGPCDMIDAGVRARQPSVTRLDVGNA